MHHCYKFTFWHYWLCPTNFNMLHFICIQSVYIFFNFPWEFFFDPWIIWKCDIYFPSIQRFFSYLSVIDFSFNSIRMRTHILYDFNYFKFWRFILCLRIYFAYVECVLCYCVFCYHWSECSVSVASCWLMDIFTGCRVLCWQFSFQDSNDMDVRFFIIILQLPELLFIFFQSVFLVV